MHELVIRGGTVVDGTGRAARPGQDVAIDDGVIAEVGSDVGRGRREIEADGRLVLPGWVDIHTHYDGQATWDPDLTPSSWHGVTTTVFGNCGVGFAPLRPGSEEYLINLMEGVEDIPGTVLAEGIDFSRGPRSRNTSMSWSGPRGSWTSGPRSLTGHCGSIVMGDRGADHTEVPTEQRDPRDGRRR